MAINKKTPAQTFEGVNTGGSYKCATSAPLIDYNTQFGTVTIPFGYFKDLHDRILPDKYVRAEEQIRMIRQMIKRAESKEMSFVDIDDLRMVIDDE